MNLGIFGLIDIIFIVGLIIAIIAGYVTGFMKKVISKFGFLVVLLFSFMFASQLAQFFISVNFIFPDIKAGFQESLTNYCNEYAPTSLPSYSVVIEKGIGIVEPFATLLKWIMGNPSFTEVEGQSINEIIVSQGSTVLATKAVLLISFLIIFIFSLITLIILKVVASTMRKNGLIKFIDGVLGVLLMVGLYIFAFAGILFIMKLIRDANFWDSYNNFLDTDLQLQTSTFRISKGIYNANIYEYIKDFIIGLFHK